VLVEELHYGAVAVAQRLEELRPELLILVGAVVSGRPPGTVERRIVERAPREAAEVQRAVGDAVTGYVGIDLVLEVAAGLGALPARTIAIEVEPASVEPSEHLSPKGRAALERVLELVKEELARAAPGSVAGSRAAFPRPSPRSESRPSTS
jgi:Ni,Fe-hydrogenase maturation factor